MKACYQPAITQGLTPRESKDTATWQLRQRLVHGIYTHILANVSLQPL